jgi:niacin transporter
MLLVGVGTVIHSMVDYWLAQIVWKTVGKKALPLRSV